MTSLELKQLILDQLKYNLRYLRGFMIIDQHGRCDKRFVVDIWSEQLYKNEITRPYLMDTVTRSEVKIEVPVEVRMKGDIGLAYEMHRSMMEFEEVIYKSMINELR